MTSPDGGGLSGAALLERRLRADALLVQLSASGLCDLAESFEQPGADRRVVKVCATGHLRPIWFVLGDRADLVVLSADRPGRAVYAVVAFSPDKLVPVLRAYLALRAVCRRDGRE